MAPRSSRSLRPPAGRSIPSAAPSPARSRRNWASRSRPRAPAKAARTRVGPRAAPLCTGSPGRRRRPAESAGSADMHGLLKRPGYRLYCADSPEAEAVLAEVGVTRAELDRALAALERSQGIRVRSIVGINQDAVFGSTREGWRPDLPDACKEPFVPLLWLKILELLGRVPRGSTARFLADGTPPGTVPPVPRSPADEGHR